jgi:hypothetical protein
MLYVRLALSKGWQPVDDLGSRRGGATGRQGLVQMRQLALSSAWKIVEKWAGGSTIEQRTHTYRYENENALCSASEG